MGCPSLQNTMAGLKECWGRWRYYVGPVLRRGGATMMEAVCLTRGEIARSTFLILLPPAPFCLAAVISNGWHVNCARRRFGCSERKVWPNSIALGIKNLR